jgi:hypothetical protein
MSHILDRFAAAARPPSRRPFRVSTRPEMFALQLARKLNDVESVQLYIALSQRHSEQQLLQVYRRTLKRSAEPADDLAKCFHVELNRCEQKGVIWTQ